MNYKVINIFVSIILLVTILGCGAAQQNKQHSRQTSQSILNGTATIQEKRNFVFNGVSSDQVTMYALTDVWNANPGEYPISDFTKQITPEQVPASIRTTSVGMQMVHLAAINMCFKEEPCLNMLVDFIKNINNIPLATLKLAYTEHVRIENSSLQRQVASNFNNAIINYNAKVKVQQNKAIVSSMPEGKVLDFYTDPHSNLLIKREVNSAGNQVIKSEKDGGISKLADVLATRSGFLITLLNGERYKTKSIELTYFGFISINGNKIKSYDGEILNSIQIPQGFKAAKIQRNNIHETGLILLEKVIDKRDGGFLDSFKSLGSSLGINKKEDYILLSLKNGTMFKLDVDTAGKELNYYSGCKAKKKGLFPYNSCSKMISKESLESKLGGQNSRHYYWAIDWARTKLGTVAAVNEGTELVLLNFDTGAKTIAFKRGMGINRFTLSEHDSGEVSIDVRLGFSSESLDNVFNSFSVSIDED